MKKNLNDRIAISSRKLSLNKESLKRLTSKDMSLVAGGQRNEDSLAGDCNTFWFGTCV